VLAHMATEGVQRWMMSNHYWASFGYSGADLEPAHAHPPGEAIARRIRAGLVGYGADVGDVENWRDIGWSATVRIDGIDVYFFISKGTEDNPRWVLCCTSDRSEVLAWLTRKPSDDAQKLALARLIEKVLSVDDHVSDVRWHPAGWKGPDSPGVARLSDVVAS
jgi:hypothetical protein